MHFGTFEENEGISRNKFFTQSCTPKTTSQSYDAAIWILFGINSRDSRALFLSICTFFLDQVCCGPTCRSFHKFCSLACSDSFDNCWNWRALFPIFSLGFVSIDTVACAFVDSRGMLPFGFVCAPSTTSRAPLPTCVFFFFSQQFAPHSHFHSVPKHLQ